MMKRMVLATMLAVGSMVSAHGQTVAAAGEPQAKDDLFAGTEKFGKNATDVTEVTMDPQALGTVEGKDKGRARSMKLNVVRTYSYDKPGMYDMAEVDAFRAKLMTGDWHCSVHVRSLKTGESTDVCNKRRTDDMVESAIITVEPKSLTFIHTIKQRSHEDSWSWGKGSSQSSGASEANPLDDESALGGWPLAFDPEMKARMAIMGAEMRAQMATMQPELMASMAEMKANAATWGLNGLKLQLNGIKDLELPDAQHLKLQMHDAQKQLDKAKREAQHTIDPPQPE